MRASSSTSTASATSAKPRRALAAGRPLAADAEVDENDDSPQSAPHMSISLFLEGDTSSSSSSSSSGGGGGGGGISRSSSSSVPSTATTSRSSTIVSPTLHSSQQSPSASHSTMSDFPVPSVPSNTQPELYFQSGDIIFVVPPPPAAEYATAPTPSGQTDAAFAGLPGTVMMRRVSSSSSSSSASSCCAASSGGAVLYPDVHLVNVYILPSLLCVATLRGHDSCVEQVYRDEWCDASDQVITQTALGSVYVWTLSTGELVQRMEARSSWLSAFLMTRRLFPLPAVTEVSGLQLDDSQLPSIASSSTDDEDAAMLSGASASVSVYENQRFYPLLGWSSKLLPTDRPPFSNARGSQELSKSQFKLLPRWRWLSGWEVLRDDATDVDGWSYAIDFSSTSKRGEYRGFHRKTFIHSVRRRKWVRHRQATYQPTAQALASSTLDHYIEQKHTADSPLPRAAHVSFNYSPSTSTTTPTHSLSTTATAAAQVSDKPSRSTPLLSPSPIKTRSRKAKSSGKSRDRLTTDEPRVLTRPTSRSSASDQEAPSVSLSLPPSPSPRSAHVGMSSPAGTAKSASTSTSTSPSLPSPHTRRRHASATAREASSVANYSSSPPVSPSTLTSVLTRVKPSDELKQTIKRMLLSHNGATPARSPNPFQVAQSSSSASATTSSSATKPASASASATSPAPSSTRPKAARNTGHPARTAVTDTLIDEQKERSSSTYQPVTTVTSPTVAQHNRLLESKEAENSSLSSQPLAKDTRARRKKEQKEDDEAGTEAGEALQKEPVRRKKPISYNTLPSPPRSSSNQSLTLLTDSTICSSSSSTASVASSRWIRVEVWENQRNYPVLGWSSRLLPTDPYPPFSDSAGHVLTFEMCELMLPLDMDWLMDWTVQRQADTDADGWQYAVDWSWEWSGKQRVLTTVRRRCWTREKAVRGSQQQLQAEKRDTVRRRKQQQLRQATLPSDLLSVGGKRRSGQTGNSATSHSRSQSLYGTASLTQSSSMQSLSSLAASSTAASSSYSSSATADSDVSTTPSYYDPTAGDPEEL